MGCWLLFLCYPFWLWISPQGRGYLPWLLWCGNAVNIDSLKKQSLVMLFAPTNKETLWRVKLDCGEQNTQLRLKLENVASSLDFLIALFSLPPCRYLRTPFFLGASKLGKRYIFPLLLFFCYFPALYKGDTRTRTIDIYVDDVLSKTWTSSGTTSSFESVSINATGQKVELRGDLTNSEWLSISEVCSSREGRLRVYWSTSIV